MGAVGREGARAPGSRTRVPHKTTKDHNTGTVLTVMEPYTPAWHRAAYAKLKEYHNVYPCRECGGPVVERYCCGRCGSDEP